MPPSTSRRVAAGVVLQRAGHGEQIGGVGDGLGHHTGLDLVVDEPDLVDLDTLLAQRREHDLRQGLGVGLPR
jgi:hypothetical protein